MAITEEYNNGYREGFFTAMRCIDRMERCECIASEFFGIVSIARHTDGRFIWYPDLRNIINYYKMDVWSLIFLLDELDKDRIRLKNDEKYKLIDLEYQIKTIDKIISIRKSREVLV